MAETPQPILDALKALHPDPFTQAAIQRLYVEAPGLLDERVVTVLHDAETLAAQTIQEN